MRITIGGVLVVGGLTAAGLVGPSRQIIHEQLSGTALALLTRFPQLASAVGYDVPKPGVEPLNEMPLRVVPTPDPAVTPATPAAATEPVSPEIASAVPPEPVAAEPVAPVVKPATPVPAQPPVTRRKRRRRITPVAAPAAAAPASRTRQAAAPAAKPAAAAKSAPAGAPDKLVGTYVSATLKNGNVVKGFLREKSATHYKIELPGLGPFEYPLANVVKIAPAD